MKYILEKYKIFCYLLITLKVKRLAGLKRLILILVNKKVILFMCKKNLNQIKCE